MESKLAIKIMEECGRLFDTLPDERFNTWDFLFEVHKIVSKYKGLDCLMNVSFGNGNITKALCVITDWKPGAIAFQSDDGKIPKIRVICPEEYKEFMTEAITILDPDYPEFPEEQE